MRTLIYVPRMYRKDEFEKLTSEIPEDFDVRSEEFWNYVESKLKPFVGHIHKVYYESLYKGGEEGMKILNSFNNRDYSIIKELVEKGAKLQETEDRLLVLETQAWLEQARSKSDIIIKEMYDKCIGDRSKHISNVIDQTLKDNEIGIIFIESGYKLNLPEDIRVIKMCPFEPSDYLNIQIQKLKLRKANL